jgi:hypothetical protein
MAEENAPLMPGLLEGLGHYTQRGLRHIDPSLQRFAMRMSSGNEANLGAIMAGLLPSTYYAMTTPSYPGSDWAQGFNNPYGMSIDPNRR